jgi:hypothetical protein
MRCLDEDIFESMFVCPLYFLVMWFLLLFAELTLSSHRNQLLDLLEASDTQLPALVANSLLEVRTASHHDRRRSHDVAEPCESKDPPDTNDSDCVNTRWNLIVQYFPVHSRLVRWDTKLVTAEVATEDMSDSILKRIARNWYALFGHSKKGKKVDRNSLVGQMLKLRKVVGLIENIIVDDSLIRAEWVLGNMTENARHDKDTLKWNILDSNSALLNNTKDIMGNFSLPNFFRNRDQMNRDATLILHETLNNLTISLRLIQKRCDDITKALSGADGRANKLLNRVGVGIDKLIEKLYAVGAKIQASDNKAHENLTLILAATLVTLKAKFDEVDGTVNSRLDSIEKETSEQTDSEISGFFISMDHFLKNKTRSIESDVDALYRELDEASNQLGDSAKQSTLDIKNEISNSTNRVKLIDKDASKVYRDQGDFVDVMTDKVGEKSNKIPSTTSSLIDAGLFAQEKSRDMFSKLLSSGNVKFGSALYAMINGLANMAQTGAEHVDEKADTMLLRLAQQLGLLGSQTSGIASDLGDIGSRIATSSNAVSRVITDQFDDFRQSENRLGRSLMQQLDDLGWIKPDDDVVTDIETELNEGSSVVENEVQETAETTSKNLASLQHGINRNSVTNLDRLRTIVSILSQLMLSPDFTPTISEDPVFDSLAKLVAVSDDTISTQLRDVVSGLQQVVSDELSSKPLAQVPDESKSISGIEKKFNSDSVNLETSFRQTGTLSNDLQHSTRGVLKDLDSVQDEFGQQLANVQNRFSISQPDGLPLASLDAFDTVQAEADKAITLREETINKNRQELQANVDSVEKELKDIGLENRIAKEIGLVAVPTDKISPLFDSISDTLALGQTEFAHANSSLNSLRTSTNSFLSGIASNISAELVRIPSIWSTRQIQVMNQFDLASTQLERQSLELREKMALASTASQREALAQQLVVAERLKGVQEGIAISLANISNPVVNQHILDSMQVLTIAVSSMSGPNEYVQATRDSIADTATETATLINGYKFIVDSSSNQLSQDAAQAALDQAFAVTQNDVTGQSAWSEGWKDINKIKTDVVDGNSAFTNNAHTNATHDIAILSDIASIASSSVSEHIEHILNTLENSKLSIGSSDEPTALALVRQATQQFIALWSQYGSMMNRKLSRLELGDKAWILNSRMSAAKELDELTNPYTAPLSDLTQLGTQTGFAMNDSVIFFNNFEKVVNDSRQILGSIHRLATDKMDMSNVVINSVLNESASGLQATLNMTRQLLDDFDNSE